MLFTSVPAGTWPLLEHFSFHFTAGCRAEPTRSKARQALESLEPQPRAPCTWPWLPRGPGDGDDARASQPGHSQAAAELAVATTGFPDVVVWCALCVGTRPGVAGRDILRELLLLART